MSIRLLRTDTLEIEQFGFGQIPKYAILSHRWGEYELTLQDVNSLIWTKRGFENDIPKVEAFRKVKYCCARAKFDSFKYVWIDSCCIDKTSSAELSEAINSMYLWYYQSTKCYAYLADVQSISTFKKSEWFLRGWTLQELLAPSEVYFVNRDWKDLGTKTSLRQAISDQTQIPVNILSGADLETASIAQRMSWASNRRTTRIEDRAYCLMGIFGINMPLLYGEGERAFIRLQEEIMKISNDHSIFAWKSSDIRGGLLATSPSAFIGSNNVIEYNPFGNLTGPLTVSSRGVHLEVQFIGRGPRGLGMAILHCKERGGEDKPLAIYLRDTTLTMELFERVYSESLDRIDLQKFRPSQYPMRKICIRVGRMSVMGKPDGAGKLNGVLKENDIYNEATLNKLMSFPDTSELFLAAQAGQQDVVWLLLTRNDVNADSRDENGQTVLYHAATSRQEALFKTLLARRDINADSKDNNGQTTLSWVAGQGHETIGKLLLEKGVDIETKDNVGRTPLSWAAWRGNEAMVKLLLEKGADVKVKNARRAPLSWAVEGGNEAIIELLIQKGAEIEAKDTAYYRTPLSWAAVQGNKATIQLLLEKGADIEAKDKIGRTPLLLAVESGNEANVKLLVEKGAAIEARDMTYGRTPLSWAVESGNESIMKLLVKKGAKTAYVH
ncbi:hypothetical protein ACSS6W_001645 [Trichoderma asperelloides]